MQHNLIEAIRQTLLQRYINLVSSVQHFKVTKLNDDNDEKLKKNIFFYFNKRTIKFSRKKIIYIGNASEILLDLTLN